MKKSQWVMEVAEWVVTKALSESTKDNDPSYVNYSTLLKPYEVNGVQNYDNIHILSIKHNETHNTS